MAKEPMVTPFSNGTEAMVWYSENCATCKRSWHPGERGFPHEVVLKRYVREGKYCKLQYDLDLGFITGEIPESTAKQIGEDEGGLKETCLLWSERDDNEGCQRKPRKPRDSSGPNQFVLPFVEEEINQLTPKPKRELQTA